jgi:ferredoxin
MSTVDREACIGCGACATAAPVLFRLDRGRARLVRSPRDHDEETLARAAAAICPTSAITASLGKRETDAIEESTQQGIYARLFDEAERARWRLADLPWDRIDRARVTPALVRFVRLVATSELTTTSATARFLQEMHDDVDFTHWMSVWFYEETKHPEALLRWLAFFGEGLGEREILRGRVSAPFMRSRTGTLVTNLLSEIFASAGYQDLARWSPEPVLAEVARRLAGDEARHAASFFVFARRAIDRARAPDVERLQALKVLYFWLQAADQVEHPVRQFHARVRSDAEVAALLDAMTIGYEPIFERARQAVSALVDLPIESSAQVLEHVTRLSERREPR